MYDNINDFIFIIDSDNIKKVKNHIYGWLMYKNKVYMNCDIPSEMTISSDMMGVFVAVISDGKRIRILQDSMSTFQLYIYQDESYFCIGNNFYSLCEHILNNGKKLTIDKLYAKELICTRLAPLTPERTLANEIKVIPMFCDVEILFEQSVYNRIVSVVKRNTPKVNNEIHVHKKRVSFESVDIDSEEGMKEFESWINRWCSFIYSALVINRFP